MYQVFKTIRHSVLKEFLRLLISMYVMASNITSQYQVTQNVMTSKRSSWRPKHVMTSTSSSQRKKHVMTSKSSWRPKHLIPSKRSSWLQKLVRTSKSSSWRQKVHAIYSRTRFLRGAVTGLKIHRQCQVYITYLFDYHCTIHGAITLYTDNTGYHFIIHRGGGGGARYMDNIDYHFTIHGGGGAITRYTDKTLC